MIENYIRIRIGSLRNDFDHDFEFQQKSIKKWLLSTNETAKSLTQTWFQFGILMLQNYFRMWCACNCKQVVSGPCYEGCSCCESSTITIIIKKFRRCFQVFEFALHIVVYDNFMSGVIVSGTSSINRIVERIVIIKWEI